MFLAKVKTLEFNPKPNEHTVTYDQTARKAAFDEGRDMDRQLQHVIAASYDEAVELLREVIKEYLTQFVQVRLKPEDFRISVWVEPVRGHRLWNNCCHCAGTHSL